MSHNLNKPVIAVTGLNAVDSPGPGVPVLRSLKESDLKPTLIGLAYDVLEPGNFMPELLDASFIVPYPSAGATALYERIKVIHEKFPIDIILPTLDSELDNYIEIQDLLKNMGISMFLPDKESLHLRDKSKLNDSFENTNVLLPETITLGDVTALKDIHSKLDYPFFLKGQFYDAYMVRNYEEAVGIFYKISYQWGLPVIAQQNIKGEEYNTTAFANNGEMQSAVVMKKLFLTDKGKAWAGVTIENEEILKMSKEILAFLKWNGGCELEYILEAKTNKVYLLEMNPRFPAWQYLATAVGQNMPDMLVKTAMGKEVSTDTADSMKYDIGKIFVRHSWDDIIEMKDLDTLSTIGEVLYKKNNKEEKE